MPRRRRSCTSRSSLCALAGDAARGPGADRFSRSFLSELSLAAIFHRDYRAEQNVQSAETGGEQHATSCRSSLCALAGDAATGPAADRFSRSFLSELKKEREKR